MASKIDDSIRKALRECGGLTLEDIQSYLPNKRHSKSTIHARLRNMPDTYVKSWVKESTGRYDVQIWSVVIPPADCPRPNSYRNGK